MTTDDGNERGYAVGYDRLTDQWHVLGEPAGPGGAAAVDDPAGLTWLADAVTGHLVACALASSDTATPAAPPDSGALARATELFGPALVAALDQALTDPGSTATFTASASTGPARVAMGRLALAGAASGTPGLWPIDRFVLADQAGLRTVADDPELAYDALELLDTLPEPLLGLIADAEPGQGPAGRARGTLARAVARCAALGLRGNPLLSLLGDRDATAEALLRGLDLPDAVVAEPELVFRGGRAGRGGDAERSLGVTQAEVLTGALPPGLVAEERVKVLGRSVVVTVVADPDVQLWARVVDRDAGTVVEATRLTADPATGDLTAQVRLEGSLADGHSVEIVLDAGDPVEKHLPALLGWARAGATSAGIVARGAHALAPGEDASLEEQDDYFLAALASFERWAEAARRWEQVAVAAETDGRALHRETADQNAAHCHAHAAHWASEAGQDDDVGYHRQRADAAGESRDPDFVLPFLGDDIAACTRRVTNRNVAAPDRIEDPIGRTDARYRAIWNAECVPGRVGARQAGQLWLEQAHDLNAQGEFVQAGHAARRALYQFRRADDLVGMERAQQLLDALEAR